LEKNSTSQAFGSWGRLPFDRPPKFFDCTIGQGFFIHPEVVFPPPNPRDEYAARAYQTLKLAFNKLQAVRDEQRFFRLEMEEEALKEVGLKSFFFKAYKECSDYGFSVARPFFYFIAMPALLATLFYAILFEYRIYTSNYFFHEVPNSTWWNGLTFWVLTTFPIPSLDIVKDIRVSLFGNGDWVSFIALIIEMTQKSLAFIGFFLIGLALRNLFKLK
jgi:hypothetical protein